MYVGGKMGLFEYVKNLFNSKKRVIKKEKKKTSEDIMAIVRMMNGMTRDLTKNMRLYVNDLNYRSMNSLVEQYKNMMEPMMDQLCYNIDRYKKYATLEEILVNA